jgi:DNA-binding NarL/FixJ family response regulator
MERLRTKVLLCQMPRLLSDIVRSTLGDVDDVDVVGEVEDVAALAAAAQALGASVAICGGPLVEEAAALHALLFARSPLRVIEVAEHGRSASVIELVPRRTALGELSPELLLRIVRPDRHDVGDRAD